MSQHKNVNGRFVKSLSTRCPDCEKGILQVRDLEGYLFNICNLCSYQEENEQGNKKNISKLREMKINEKNEVHRDKTRVNRRDYEANKKSFKQTRR